VARFVDGKDWLKNAMAQKALEEKESLSK